MNGMAAVPIGQPQEAPAEPVFKTPELAKRWEKLKALMQANGAALDEIQAKARQYGGQFVLQPGQMEQLKFAALLDLLFPGDTEEGQHRRLDLDFKVQEALTSILEQARAGITQAALSAGAMLPPDQMAALLKQQAPGLAKTPERRTR